MENEDVFWGRCAVKTKEEIEASPFVYDHELPQPHWRPNNLCSHCGGMRPSIALKAIREGAEVVPTDKNYKIYIKPLPGMTLPGSPANKCYLNHFSQAQAVEFVLLHETNKMKVGFPGHFYSGLCFGIYKDAIQAAITQAVFPCVSSSGTEQQAQQDVADCRPRAVDSCASSGTLASGS